MVTESTREVRQKILASLQAREFRICFRDGTVESIPVELDTTESTYEIRSTRGLIHTGEMERIELRNESGGVLFTIKGEQLDLLEDRKFLPKLIFECWGRGTVITSGPDEGTRT